MDFSIRKLALADQPLADDFFRDLTPEGNMFYNHQNDNENNLRRQLQEPKDSRIDFGAMETAADGTERMIAHIFLYHADTGIPWIGICLRAGCTGRHLGGQLLQYLEDVCKSRHAGGMMLTTHSANIRAQTLYRNFGFVYLGFHSSGEFMFYKPFPLGSMV